MLLFIEVVWTGEGQRRGYEYVNVKYKKEYVK